MLAGHLAFVAEIAIKRGREHPSDEQLHRPAAQETKEKQKARAKKAKHIDKEPKESAKAKEKGQQKEKQAVQEKEPVTEHPKEREKRVPRLH